MDRPKQAARSFRRMVGEAWREELNERLTIWPGPPWRTSPAKTVTSSPCAEGRRGHRRRGPLKDAALGLNDDEVGAGYNRARQRVIESGVQMLELHHNRKAAQGNGKRELALDDLYGSVWLTSGVGSVVLLTGKPGDPVVGLVHLKPSVNVVGPLQVRHDHVQGAHLAVPCPRSRRAGHDADIGPRCCMALHDTDKPTEAQKEAARRKLINLAGTGHLRVVQDGEKGSRTPTTWVAANPTVLEPEDLHDALHAGA